MLARSFSHDERLMGMALGFYQEEFNGQRVVGHGGGTASARAFYDAFFPGKNRFFLGVMLRRFYQRDRIRSLPAADRWVINAGVYAAAANVLAAIVGASVLAIVLDRLLKEMGTSR